MCGLDWNSVPWLISVVKKREALLCSAVSKACTKNTASMVVDKASTVNIRSLPFQNALRVLLTNYLSLAFK